MDSPAAAPELSTVSELVEVLNLSRTAIYNHINRAGLQPEAGKRYRVRRILEIILEHRADDNRLKSSPELKTQKLQIETQILENRLRQLEGELVPLEQIRAQNFDIARTIRDRLLAIPEQLADGIAAETSPHEIQKLMGDAIREALEELKGTLDPDEAAAVE